MSSWFPLERVVDALIAHGIRFTAFVEQSHG
jgi:hypothetical protein